MIDIAWSEFLFIALLALILIGPKELPAVLRNIGYWIGKARTVAKSLTEQLDLHSHIETSKADLNQTPPIIQSHEPPKDDETKPLENIKP